MIEIKVTPYSNDKARATASLWYEEHREHVLAKRKRDSSKKVTEAISRRRKWKAILYSLLGNVCVKCGFSDQRALQIDHIQGCGTQGRKKHSRCMATYYRLLALSPELRAEVQLLCANCNWIKRDENDELD